MTPRSRARGAIVECRLPDDGSAEQGSVHRLGEIERRGLDAVRQYSRELDGWSGLAPAVDRT